MSSNLNHPPGQVIQQLLIDLGKGSDVEDLEAWPIYYANHPDSPDDSICIRDTEGVKHGRHMTSGEVLMHYGIQVMVRSANIVDGYVKAKRISVAFDEDVYQEIVEMGSGHMYSIQSISRLSDVLYVGTEVGATRRHLYSLNAIVSLRLTEEGTGTAS